MARPRGPTTPGDGLAALTVGKRYVEAGPRQADEKRNVFRVTAGLRGDIGSNDEGFLSNLAYDAYYTYARTETTELLFNALSRSRLQASQLSAGGAAPVCNVFGSNVSEACASAIRISATNTTEATLQVASASITGDLFELWGGPAGFSFGGEWRKTAAQYRPDSFLSSGDVVGFNAGLPTGGSITAKEVFGEVRLPILRDEPFFEELTLNGAFRYSDYSLDGVGGVWTYLGGAEWQPVQDIRFRAQFQHAIRAPNVGDLYAGSTRSVPVATDPCSSRQPVAQQTAAVRAVCVATGVPTAAVFTAGVQPNNFFPVDAGGNPNLGPEESDTFTAGVVLTPSFVPNLRISADYFDISLDGAIAPLGGGLNNTMNLCYNVLQDPSSEFCQAVNRNPVTGEINDPYTVKILQANTGGLETSGIDFALQYAIRDRRGGAHQRRERLDLDRRIYLDPGSGDAQHPEPMRRLLGPDLWRADPRMARDHPHQPPVGDLERWPPSPLHLVGNQRSLHPADAARAVRRRRSTRCPIRCCRRATISTSTSRSMSSRISSSSAARATSSTRSRRPSAASRSAPTPGRRPTTCSVRRCSWASSPSSDRAQGTGLRPSVRTTQPCSGNPGAAPCEPSQPAAIIATARSSEPFDGK